jgi:hypothetical protein
MTWDSRKMADVYLKRANAIHPEEELESEKDSLLALQNLYYECYMMAFSYPKLIEMLKVSAGGKFEVPEDVNEKIYRDAYMSNAGKLAAELQNTYG